MFSLFHPAKSLSHLIHLMTSFSLASLLLVSPGVFGENLMSKPVSLLNDTQSGTSIEYYADWTPYDTLDFRYTSDERFIAGLKKDEALVRLTTTPYKNLKETIKNIHSNACVQNMIACDMDISSFTAFNTMSGLMIDGGLDNIYAFPLKLNNTALVIYTQGDQEQGEVELNDITKNISSSVSTPEHIIFKEGGLTLSYPRVLKKYIPESFPESDIQSIFTLVQPNNNQRLDMVSVFRADNENEEDLETILSEKIAAYQTFCELLNRECPDESFSYQVLETQLEPAIVVGGWEDPETGAPIVQVYVPAYRGSSYLYIEANNSYPDLDKLIGDIQFVD